MKKFIPIIIIGVVVILGAGIGVFAYISGKTKFNDGYVNGNTPGNLYNEGLYCEYGDTIYFANPDDGGKLYSMDTNGGNLTKLCDDVVSSINADENYLYYVRDNPGSGNGALSFLSISTNGLCRIDRDGGADSILILDSDPCIYAALSGNYVYYVHYTSEEGSSVYKVKIDGSDRKQVDANPHYTCSVNGQYMYYGGLDTDHYIWRLDTENDTSGMLYGGNCWMPMVTDDSTAYFMDCDNNYAIAHVDFATGEKTILAEDRADWYNVYGDYIYFQKNDAEAPALCRMRTDGSGYEELAFGNHMNINVTSTYVYFKDFVSEQTFRVPTYGTAEPEIFAPGKAE